MAYCNIGNSQSIVWYKAIITRAKREKQNSHKSFTLWFTGLPSSGKSTIAHAIEERLYKSGCRTYVLDGDNIRHGLCGDLGFSIDDRKENIRRVGEIVKLFVDAGIIVMTAFISPHRKDRDWVKYLVGRESFIEIYCDCSLNICEKRDLKGHYAKARMGEIPAFTGISSIYEEPDEPELHLKTDSLSVKECVDVITEYLVKQKFIVRK